MKVILQENMDNLGYVGDILDVANGYARNYLLPRRKALEANPRNVKALEHAKRLTGHKAKKLEHSLQDVADKLSKVSLTFPVQTGKDGKLFGSVTSKDIEEGIVAQGFEVDRRKIQLDQPIKELGTSTVPIKLHRDIIANVTVSVIRKGEDQQAPEPVETAASEGDSEGDSEGERAEGTEESEG